jgi:ATP-dependent RNA helicase DDX21
MDAEERKVAKKALKAKREKKEKPDIEKPESEMKKRKAAASSDEEEVAALAAAVPEGAASKRPRTRSMDAAEPRASAEDKELPPGHLSRFALSSATLTALRLRGIESLFAIQAQTFSLIRSGRDVIGKARTGQGKTLAFALPIAEMLQELGLSLKPGRPPAAVVIAPTRELAGQVASEIATVCVGFVVLTVYGGTPYPPQFTALRAVKPYRYPQVEPRFKSNKKGASQAPLLTFFLCPPPFFLNRNQRVWTWWLAPQAA